MRKIQSPPRGDLLQGQTRNNGVGTSALRAWPSPHYPGNCHLGHGSSWTDIV